MSRQSHFLIRFGVALFVLALIFVAAVPLVNAKPTIPSAPSHSLLLYESGKLVADTGFRPEANGFSFPNYNNKAGAENLTAEEMRTLFGDQVCAILRDNLCVLTPVAAEQMAQFNQTMAVGHCDGLATLSALLYLNIVHAADFGADTTARLQLAGNQKLQRELARWFTTQLVDPTYAAKLRFVNDKITPAQVVDTLIEAMNSKSETYTMAFFKRGYRDGHAITPYAVADEGNGLYHILIYDNNFPGEERAIEVDHNANTWKYAASINPDVPKSLYDGDAKSGTLMLVPLSLRLQKQDCPFCNVAGNPDSTATAVPTAAPTATSNTTSSYNEILMTTTAQENQLDLLIKDAQGRRLGYDKGDFYSEIPGAFFVPITSGDLWEDNPEPIFYVPATIDFTVILDGSTLTKPETANISVFGPGHDALIENIKLDQGQTDTIKFSPDATKVTYQPGKSEAPDIIFDLNQTSADYELRVNGFNLDSGAAVNFILDKSKGTLAINTSGAKKNATYALEVNRVDDHSDSSFYHPGIDLAAGATAYINYGQWSGNGALSIGIDSKSNGQIGQTIQESDMSEPVGVGYVQTAGSGTFTANQDGSYNLQLMEVSPNSVHLATSSPLNVHQIETDRLIKAWTAGGANVATNAVIELDHVSVYATLSEPVSDATNHTLTYKAIIDQVLPTGAVATTATVPDDFGIANVLINESLTLSDALMKSGQLASLTSGGDFNVNAGNLDLTSGGDFNVNAGLLPGANIALIGYYQAAANGTLAASGDHYMLTLSGVYPMALSASATPMLGLAWISTDALHKTWADGEGKNNMPIDAILNSGTKRIALRLSKPVSDPAKHTLTYEARPATTTTKVSDFPAKFDKVDLLISRTPLLETLVNIGANTAAKDVASLTSGGDFNVNAGMATKEACQTALKQLTDKLSADTPVETLTDLNVNVEGACTASAALFTPDARRLSARVSELTLLPHR